MSPRCSQSLSHSSTTWPSSKRLFQYTDFLWADRTFCVAVSFTNMLKKFSMYIQTPHSQAVLMTSVFSWGEISVLEDAKTIREELFGARNCYMHEDTQQQYMATCMWIHNNSTWSHVPYSMWIIIHLHCGYRATCKYRHSNNWWIHSNILYTYIYKLYKMHMETWPCLHVYMTTFTWIHGRVHMDIWPFLHEYMPIFTWTHDYVHMVTWPC
jgi:hypothetical protein